MHMLRTKHLLLGAHADLVVPLLFATVVGGGPARVAIVEVAVVVLVVLRAEAAAALAFTVVMAVVTVGLDEELAAIAKTRVVDLRVPAIFVTRALVAAEAVA